MDIRITTLSENTAGYGFLAEWGLSMLVEAEGLNLLMDAGFGPSAVHNADLLGVDLSQIDKIILSHGHRDHCGGLAEVLGRRGEVEVIAHPDAWTGKYARRPTGEQFVGPPCSLEELQALGARFTLSREPLWLTENIITSGEIPMLTDFEELDADLFLKQGDAPQPDPLLDDLSLFLKTELGLVVVLGCAHRGLINILYHAQKVTGEELIYAVIGGTHLLRATSERLERTILELQSLGIQRLGVSHCTGFQASARLAQEFGPSFFLNNAGHRFSLP